ncbi:MAG TPA: nucleotidyltransferase substrate binding protein [Terriglobales bacterium]|nr:nucleotidyltransferase substrate binding protein [Terriglobales bacterium]
MDVSPLRRSIASLERALAQEKDEFVRDSVIQRFEYTYEISWKLLKRHLTLDEGAENIEPLSRKELFRVAAEKGLLDDVTRWFGYHRARNETSHAYDEARAEEVYEAAKQFVADARELLTALERRRG